MKVSRGDEGTNCWVCTKCGEACDAYDTDLYDPLAFIGEFKKMPLTELMANYAVGSGEWPWRSEMVMMFNEDHFDKTIELIHSIRQYGMHDAVQLGNDGRVWDGHHRITAAYVLGLEEIPVEVFK